MPKKSTNPDMSAERCLEKKIMRAKSLPVSRELARIIRDSSRLEGNHTLNEHLQAVTARQAKALQFYLRACALRLEQSA